MKRGSVKIALSYLVISLLWIALSDNVLFLLKPEYKQLIYIISTIKGFLFVAATTMGLYFLIRRNEHDILINEIRYREIYEGNPNPMWIYDPETLCFTSVNDAALIKYGYNREEFLKMTILDIRPEEDREEIVNSIRDHIETLTNKGTWRHLTKSGQLLYVNVTLNVISFKGKRNFMALIRDVTETIEREQQLKDAVARYELVAKATQDVFYDFDLENDKLEYHGSISKMVNMPKELIENGLEWWRRLIHPDDVAEVEASQREVIERRKSVWECEYRLKDGRGGYKYVYDQAYLMFNDHNEPVRMIGVVKDIDAIKASEKENKRLANIIMNVNNMVLVTDTNLRITWVNHAFERFTGYDLADVIGKLQHELMMDSVKDKASIDTLKDNFENWQTFAMELPLRNAEGKDYWVNAEFTPMTGDKGRWGGYISVQSDITLRKEKEAEINKQIGALRDIAWMGSHQIRKPVATILGLVNLMEMAPHNAEMAELIDLLKTTSLELDMVVHEINFEAFHSIEPDKLSE